LKLDNETAFLFIYLFIYLFFQIRHEIMVDADNLGISIQENKLLVRIGSNYDALLSVEKYLSVEIASQSNRPIDENQLKSRRDIEVAKRQEFICHLQRELDRLQMTKEDTHGRMYCFYTDILERQTLINKYIHSYEMRLVYPKSKWQNRVPKFTLRVMEDLHEVGDEMSAAYRDKEYENTCIYSYQVAIQKVQSSQEIKYEDIKFRQLLDDEKRQSIVFRFYAIMLISSIAETLGNEHTNTKINIFTLVDSKYLLNLLPILIQTLQRLLIQLQNIDIKPQPTRTTGKGGMIPILLPIEQQTQKQSEMEITMEIIMLLPIAIQAVRNVLFLMEILIVDLYQPTQLPSSIPISDIESLLQILFEKLLLFANNSISSIDSSSSSTNSTTSPPSTHSFFVNILCPYADIILMKVFKQPIISKKLYPLHINRNWISTNTSIIPDLLTAVNYYYTIIEYLPLLSPPPEWLESLIRPSKFQKHFINRFPKEELFVFMNEHILPLAACSIQKIVTIYGNPGHLTAMIPRELPFFQHFDDWIISICTNLEILFRNQCMQRIEGVQILQALHVLTFHRLPAIFVMLAIVKVYFVAGLYSLEDYNQQCQSQSSGQHQQQQQSRQRRVEDLVRTEVTFIASRIICIYVLHFRHSFSMTRLACMLLRLVFRGETFVKRTFCEDLLYMNAVPLLVPWFSAPTGKLFLAYVDDEEDEEKEDEEEARDVNGLGTDSRPLTSTAGKVILTPFDMNSIHSMENDDDSMTTMTNTSAPSTAPATTTEATTPITSPPRTAGSVTSSMSIPLIANYTISKILAKYAPNLYTGHMAGTKVNKGLKKDTNPNANSDQKSVTSHRSRGSGTNTLSLPGSSANAKKKVEEETDGTSNSHMTLAEALMASAELYISQPETFEQILLMVEHCAGKSYSCKFVLSETGFPRILQRYLQSKQNNLYLVALAQLTLDSLEST
jgi:hypothetical protein